MSFPVEAERFHQKFNSNDHGSITLKDNFKDYYNGKQ